jgi:hypothetical protein
MKLLLLTFLLSTLYSQAIVGSWELKAIRVRDEQEKN